MSVAPATRPPLQKAVRTLFREAANVFHHFRGSLRARRMNFKGKRMNVGCGKYPVLGWLNADIHHTADVMFDIRARWPVPDGHLTAVRLEHVLEHVEYPIEALRVLEEAYRVLAPGGWVRVGVPDTEKVILAYVQGDDAEYFRIAKEHWHPGSICLPIEHVNFHFRDRFGEHLFAYDWQALTNLLSQAGFKGIQRAAYMSDIDRSDREEGTLRLSGTKQSREEILQ